MNQCNSEGYRDPTAYKALSAMTRQPYRPLVYIASAFSGGEEDNVRRTQDYCRFAVSEGVIPLAPHLHYPQFMDENDPSQRELGLRFALILLGKCKELWAFGEESAGMKREIDKAKSRGIPIRYFNQLLQEVFGYGE